MRHAEDNLFGACAACTLNELVQGRNQTLSALQTKTLRAGVFGIKMLLEPFGCSKTLEQMSLHLDAEAGHSVIAFNALLNPLLLF